MEVWNTTAIAQWRQNHPGQRLMLGDADLARADLVGANLARANLRDANLRDANLARANLAGANLARADLGDLQIWQFGPLGSRKSYLMVKIGPNLDEAMTGCFRGTLAEFEAEVEKTHGENRHGRQYRSVIALVRQWRTEDPSPQAR